MALAVVVHRQQRAALWQVVLQPLLLGAEEPLDVGGVAAVLAGWGEQIVLPNHAVRFRQVVAELGGRRRHTAFGQRPGNLIPGNLGLAFLRLVLLPDLRLFVPCGGGDRAELLLVRHAAERHDVEHRRMEVRQKLQPADGAHRQSQRIGDRLFIPTLGLEPLNRAPDVHARHRGPDQVLGDGTHCGGSLVGIAHQHVDHRQIRLDRSLHPAIADSNHQLVAIRV